MQENVLINDLDDIMIKAAYGNLETRISSKAGIITLYQLHQDVRKMALKRDMIIKQFERDAKKTFLRYDQHDDTILSFNLLKLFEDSSLDFSIENSDTTVRVLVSKDKIESISRDDLGLNRKIEQIHQYIKGLFRVYENPETKNLLANYSDKDALYLSFEDYLARFKIGLGMVKLTINNPKYKDFTIEEKREMYFYYLKHRLSLLREIYLRDDDSLNRFRTSASKSRILSIYKKR